MRNSNFTEGVYKRLLTGGGSHRKKRKQISDGLNGFDYQTDFKPFVDLRNSLAHDFGRQLTYVSYQSDPDLPDTPEEAMETGHQLASKLCDKLYGYSLEKIAEKTPDEAEPMWVIRSDLSKGSTYAIMEWVLRDVDAHGKRGRQDLREALRTELSRRGYDPGNLRIIREYRNDEVEFPYDGDIEGQIEITNLDVKRHDTRDYTIQIGFKNTSSKLLRWRAYCSKTKGTPKEYPDQVPQEIESGQTSSVEIELKNIPGDRVLVEIGVTGYTDTAMTGDRRRIFCKRVDTGESLGDFEFDLPDID